MDICCCVVGLAAIVAVIVALLLVVVLLRSDADLTLTFHDRFRPRTEALAGKVVWVTGASSGIGRALAIELAGRRCRLVVSARRKDQLDEVKRECISTGLKDEDVLVLPMNVTDMSRHEECLRSVLLHFGRLDVLVNNAGRSQRANFEDVDIRVDRELFELNVFAPVALTTTVLRGHFIERKAGQIVVTSSTAGKAAVPLSRSYTGSKHALHGYFGCLAVEHPYIDVTMLCPGPVVSDILSNAFTAKPNETCNKSHSPNAKRMSAARCARLTAVAMANRLFEVWICPSPLLLLYYGVQYCPSVTMWILRSVGVKYMAKQREGE